MKTDTSTKTEGTPSDKDGAYEVLDLGTDAAHGDDSSGDMALTVDLYGNDTLEGTGEVDTLDLIVIDDDGDADVVYGSSNSCEPVYTQGTYFNDEDTRAAKVSEEAPDVIVIEDDASADVVYGSSNSCEPFIMGAGGNDTITGAEEDPIDVITTAEGPDLDDIDILDLTTGADKDAHATYGGSNTCDPYAGENTCEPPEGGGRAELTDLQITPNDVDDGVF